MEIKYILSKMSKILDGETDSLGTLSEVIKANNFVNFKYTLINSVNIEWSFTIYKNVPMVYMVFIHAIMTIF